MADETIDAARGAAQCDDGYLNSYYQVAKPGAALVEPGLGPRALLRGPPVRGGRRAPGQRAAARGRASLRRPARDVFGDAGTCGHPEIELGLVKLFRLTGERAYLELAGKFVDRRGHATLEPATHGSSYFQNRVPVREQDEVEGHAVRALYLAAGVTDLFMETGETALLDAMRRAVARHGGAQGLRDGRGWRAPHGRSVRRRLRVAAGPLLRRNLRRDRVGLLELADAARDRRGALRRPARAHALQRRARRARARWRRLLLRQPAARARGPSRPGRARRAAPAVVRVRVLPAECHAAAGEPPALRRDAAIATAFRSISTRRARSAPSGCEPTTRGADVLQSRCVDSGRWTLALRVPSWTDGSLDGEPVSPGYATVTRDWSAGDTVTLELDMTPRVVAPHPRIDAVRGCLAIERGPLVYCLETADAPHRDGRRRSAARRRARAGRAPGSARRYRRRRGRRRARTRGRVDVAVHGGTVARR